MSRSVSDLDPSFLSSLAKCKLCLLDFARRPRPHYYLLLLSESHAARLRRGRSTNPMEHVLPHLLLGGADGRLGRDLVRGVRPRVVGRSAREEDRLRHVAVWRAEHAQGGPWICGDGRARVRGVGAGGGGASTPAGGHVDVCESRHARHRDRAQARRQGTAGRHTARSLWPACEHRHQAHEYQLPLPSRSRPCHPLPSSEGLQARHSPRRAATPTHPSPTASPAPPRDHPATRPGPP
jgi:hypothetical protein